jgi:hypothetical protein
MIAAAEEQACYSEEAADDNNSAREQEQWQVSPKAKTWEQWQALQLLLHHLLPLKQAKLIWQEQHDWGRQL